MNILQFWRILFARKWIVGCAVLACLVGAMLVISTVPPRWKATSRVMLNLLKPDPVTGMIIGGPSERAYVATQAELISDYSVVGPVVDQLGWLSDPNLIRAYQKRSHNDIRDFRRWLADIIIRGTKADVVEGSNILEITYNGADPTGAKTVVDLLRKSYLDSSLASRREDSMRSAEWYQGQAEIARKALDDASTQKTDYERQNGIVLDDKVDVETARLRSMAAQSQLGPVIASGGVQTSQAALQLAQLDTQIAQAQQTLGPNHPELKDLKSRRAAIAALVAQEGSAKAAQAAAAVGVNAMQGALNAQKARVIADRDKVARLTQLQTDVDLKLDQYNKTAGRAAALRQEAAVADTGISALGAPATPNRPSFPNIPLIMGGALFLGLVLGVLSAILAELLQRRIRGVEDLQLTVDFPVLAVIGRPQGGKRQRRLAPPKAASPPRQPQALQT